MGIIRCGVSSIIALFVVVGSALFAFEAALAEEPVLESYTIGHGGNLGARPDGVAATLTDKFLGNGTAKARIKLKAKEDSGTLSLRVSRSVGRGKITFALIVERIEVRGYDAAGALVYVRDLGGFVFGDSKSGKWEEKIEDLPLEAQQVRIIFIGNYA